MNTFRFATPDPLVRALSNGLLFACRDETRPAVCAVRFEYDAERKVLEALSTDSYRACVERLHFEQNEDTPAPPAEPFAFSLHRDDADRLLRAIKAPGQKYTPCELSTEGGREPGKVTVTVAGASYVYPTVAGHDPYPDVRKLIPEPEQLGPAACVHLEPKWLADLGKVRSPARGNRTVSLEFHRRIGEGSTGPLIVRYLDDGPLVLIMSKRVTA